MADKQLWQVVPVATDVKNDDGVIIGGQTTGTRYAPLTLIANFVHNLWASFVNALTPKTSFVSGDKIPVVNGSTATAMEASKLLELSREDIINNGYSRGLVSVDLSNRDIVQGVLNSSGEIVSSVSYIVTREIFDVSEFDIIEVTPEANYTYEIAWYDSPDESSYIGITSTTWWSDKTMIRVGGKFMRIQVRYTGGAASLSDITKIAIKGYNRNACISLQRDLQAKEGYKGEVALDIYRTFVQGAIVGGVYTPTNNSYSVSDYIDVSSFNALELYVNTGYNVYVIFYDSLKNHIQDSSILNGGTSYKIDVSNVSFVRIQIGKVASNTRTGEGINVFVSGVKKENPSVEQTIGLQKLFTQNSIVNGALSPASSRISTDSFIDISRFGIIKLNVQNGYYFSVAFYTSSSVSDFKYSTPWLYSDNKDVSFDVTKYSYIRVTLRKSDNTSLDKSYGTRVNSCVGILETACYQYGIQKKNDAKWEYEGDRVSVNPTLDFFNILPANGFTTSYSFSTYYQQGAAIHNGLAVMFRHHAACSIYDIKTMALVSEFAVTDVAADLPHMNNASFSKDYPTGNTEFPYCYVSRLSYQADTPALDFNERNSCYVFNLTTSSATLVQTIKYANTTTKFTYGYCDWVVDKERNRLIAYGRSGSYACTFLEFALPAIGSSVVQLTDDDILDEWTIDFQFWGHTFEASQGFDICGRYIFCTYSNPSFGTESLGIVDKYEHRIVACKEWSNSITDEIQAASAWNGALYIISEGCRIDKIVFN